MSTKIKKFTWLKWPEPKKKGPVLWHAKLVGTDDNPEIKISKRISGQNIHVYINVKTKKIIILATEQEGLDYSITNKCHWECDGSYNTKPVSSKAKNSNKGDFLQLTFTLEQWKEINEAINEARDYVALIGI